MEVLLLHPPLLSPYVWVRLAPLLEMAGHSVAVPSLTMGDGAVSQWWDRAADAAVSASPDAGVVIAHSGAGVLAPEVLDRLPDPQAVVLIDAVLAPADGIWTVAPQVRAAVARLAVGGVLPPWTAWWDPDEMEAQVPDRAHRESLVASTPRLTEKFFDVGVPVPEGWEPPRRGYVQLSAAYDSDAARAEARGWNVVMLPGVHLDVLSRAEVVAESVLDMLPGP